jgi:thiol-disulfide isomerase/thioredoxin
MLRPFLAVVLSLCCSPLLFAQTSAPLPGCQPSPEITKTIHDKLQGPEFDKLGFREQQAFSYKVLTELSEKYPREIVPKRRLISIARNEDDLNAGSWEKFQANYREQAKAHPDDPLVLDLAGMVLVGTDTPEAIRLLEAAKTKAPQFVWADLDLASIYSDGKFADKQKFRENLTAYWTSCPASTEGYAQWMLVKDMDLQAQVAKLLRPQLEKETDPDKLKDYEFLWSLEFRTHPPQEHDALRKQVASDVKRLETLQPHPDAAWMAFLINGYKQSGASEETIAAIGDKLVQQYPHSDEAYGIVEKRWSKAHKKPEDQKDTAAWASYHKAYREAIEQWIRQYPDNMFLKRYGRFEAVNSNDSATEQEGVAAMDEFLELGEKYDPPDWWWSKYQVADYLIEHKWQPQRAVELMQQTLALQAKAVAKEAKNDNLTDEEIKKNKKNAEENRKALEDLLLQAAVLAKRPDAVQDYRADLEEGPPKEKKEESGYWTRLARLAVLDGHRQDALLYYQRALQTRLKPPSYDEGKLTDNLMNESHALWKELGGTETAWAVWSKPPAEAAKAADASEARWEKPTQTLPAFQLADLSGKTWRLEDLKGKVVLINLWATWCGPCNAELPELEKLYEKVKGRQDIQILTFNIDEDVGLVAPYLKEKGYTFPVLPAYSYVVNLLNGFAIPQNWVLDPKGSWLWTQIGYGADDAWVQDMIQKLEATKAGS